MITSTSTDYSFRQAALSLFPDLKSSGVPAGMTIGDGRVVAGASKAAQGFLMALLSPAGEFPEDPLFGTEFSSRMTMASVRYPSDIDQIFYLEASRAIDWWNLNSRDRPLDEQIKAVELVDQSVGSAQTSLSLQLLTRAESNIAFLLPVPWSA